MSLVLAVAQWEFPLKPFLQLNLFWSWIIALMIWFSPKSSLKFFEVLSLFKTAYVFCLSPIFIFILSIKLHLGVVSSVVFHFHTSDNVLGWMSHLLEVNILLVLIHLNCVQILKNIHFFFNVNFLVPKFPLGCGSQLWGLALSKIHCCFRKLGSEGSKSQMKI